MATLCAKIADSKIAEDILVLDLEKIDPSPADFFVMCTCKSDVQVRALVSEIEDVCRVLGIQKPRIEGYENAEWVLLDFFDVVVHIMQPIARDYYKLEKLWGDAKFYKLGDGSKLVSAK
jgi:ribosome-associated protein